MTAPDTWTFTVIIVAVVTVVLVAVGAAFALYERLTGGKVAHHD